MYRLTNFPSIIHVNDDGSITSIPFEPACVEYQQYLAWLADGNTPEPYVPPPPPIPSTVTRFQALATLSAAGHLPSIRTYIATLDPDNITRLAWEAATEWERTSPTLAALATMLGLTDTEVDDLFIAASQVSA
jgi:hypothetical protein